MNILLTGKIAFLKKDNTISIGVVLSDKKMQKVAKNLRFSLSPHLNGILVIAELENNSLITSLPERTKGSSRIVKAPFPWYAFAHKKNLTLVNSLEEELALGNILHKEKINKFTPQSIEGINLRKSFFGLNIEQEITLSIINAVLIFNKLKSIKNNDSEKKIVARELKRTLAFDKHQILIKRFIKEMR